MKVEFDSSQITTYIIIGLLGWGSWAIMDTRERMIRVETVIAVIEKRIENSEKEKKPVFGYATNGNSLDLKRIVK